MKRRFLFTLFLLSFCFWDCSKNQNEIAGRSDHPNEIVGQVLSPDSSGKPTCVAHLFPLKKASFLVDRVDTADANGFFRFTNVTPGSYRVEAYNADSSEATLSDVFSVDNQDSLNLDILSLASATSISLQFSSGQGVRCDSSLTLENTFYTPVLEDNGLCVFPFMPSGMTFNLIQEGNPVSLGTVVSTKSTQVQSVTSEGILFCLIEPLCNSEETPVVMEYTEVGCIKRWRCDVSDSVYDLAKKDTSFVQDTSSIAVVLDSLNSGDTLILSILDYVKIYLSTNAGSGYSWSGPRDAGQSVVTVSRYEMMDGADSILDGVSSWHIIYLRSLSLQNQWLTWVYSKGDSIEVPADTFQILLQVSE
jgi:predicted secreted protein